MEGNVREKCVKDFIRHEIVSLKASHCKFAKGKLE